MIDIKRLSIGNLAAERDINSGLIDYFIETNSYKLFRDGDKTIALGNRGSGKSAIFRMIAEHEKNIGNLVIDITPEDYSYEMLSDVLAKELEGAWAKQSAYAAAWKYFLYIIAMKEITNKIKGFKAGSAAKIYDYLNRTHSGIDRNPVGVIVSYMSRMQEVKLGVGPYAKSVIRSRELEKLYKLEDITPYIACLDEISKKKPVTILVDELDRGWDASEDAISFVAGLFDAAISINAAHPNIRVLLALRRELYDNIPSIYHDAQKVRDVIEIVEWNEDDLLMIVTKRLSYFEPELRSADPKSVWRSVFSDVLDYRKTKSYNYVIDRTLYRPRELIQFCIEIIRDMQKSDTVPADYQTINKAEYRYSEERLKDIAGEYRFQFPGLESVFETFRGREESYERDDLFFHCMEVIEGEIRIDDAAMEWVQEKEPEQLVDILWNVGFLKALAVGGIKAERRSGSQYVGPHQVRLASVRDKPRFQIHPMFRSFLGTKELRRR